MPDAPATVDEYLAGFPPEVRDVLERVRRAIHSAVPNAEEKIRYGMPAVLVGGDYFLHFAGWKKHVGLYPVARAEGDLEAELAPYRAAKDSINFPYSKPIPYELVTRTAEFLRDRQR